MSIDSRLQINLSDNVSLLYEMNDNVPSTEYIPVVPSPFSVSKLMNYLPIVNLERARSDAAATKRIVSLVQQEGGGYGNSMSERRCAIWTSIFLDNHLDQKGEADVVNDYFSLCKVDGSYVYLQSNSSNVKSEGYLWLKGYIDEGFMED